MVLVYTSGELMAKTVVKIDKASRVVIPEAIRVLEGLKPGDVVELDISKIEPGKRTHEDEDSLNKLLYNFDERIQRLEVESGQNI